MVRQEDDYYSNDTALQEPLQQAERLYWQGKFQEVLEQLDQLEAQEDISETKQLKGQLLRCRIFAHLDVKKAQDLTTQLIQASQGLGQPLIGVDALSVMAEAWLELNMLNTSMDFVEQGKTVLTTITDATPAELTTREAMFLALEGGVYALRGELERALEYVQQSLTLRKKRDNPQAIAHSLAYLGSAYYFKGEYDRALECVQQSLTIREQLQHPQEIAQSLFDLGRLYYHKKDVERAFEYHRKSLAIREQLRIQHAVADSLSWIAWLYVENGEWERALEIFRNCLAHCEQLGIPGTSAESRCFHHLGQLYTLKGEWELALEYLQKGLAIEEEQGTKTEIAWILQRIGQVYLTKGELEAAFECLEKSLKAHEEVKTEFGIAFSLVYLIIVSIERGNLKFARHYLQRLEMLQIDSWLLDQPYKLARAMILKASPRIRDKMQAQALFQQLTTDEVIWVDINAQASLNLCELLFIEFKYSEAPEILHEIRTITTRLLDLAQRQHSYSLLAETYLLQAKLALVELDVTRARQLLTQAQAIADDKGLQRLARSISNEHDAMLRQLDHWEDLRAKEASLTETSEFSGVENLLTRLVRQRAVDPPELHPEEPVLLLILIEGGLTLFSHSFKQTRQLNEQLIGGFLSSLSAFGQDALATSGGIDRIMYEEYTVAVKPLETMLTCYIFKGHSYVALQKLEQFIESVRMNAVLWNDLTEAQQKSRVFTSSVLQELIAEVFQS